MPDRDASRVEDAIPISVPMRLLAQVPDGSGPFPVLVGLHGYAMRASLMLGLMRRFAPPDFLVVSLQGPHSAIVPGAELATARETGYHWGVSEIPADNVATHRSCLSAGVTWAVEQGGDASRISLCGFSQPCSFNYRAALEPPHGRPFRTIVALCGGVPGAWRKTGTGEPGGGAGTEASRSTAVLHVSTTEDPLYPPEKVAGYEAVLAARFLSAKHSHYEGIHRVPSAAFDEIRAFLAAEG